MTIEDLLVEVLYEGLYKNWLRITKDDAIKHIKENLCDAEFDTTTEVPEQICERIKEFAYELLNYFASCGSPFDNKAREEHFEVRVYQMKELKRKYSDVWGWLKENKLVKE